MSDKKTILYFAAVEWSRLKQRPQYLAEALSDKYKVIYIDPPESFVAFLLKLFRISKTKRTINFYLRPHLRRVSKNLTVYSSPLLLCGNRSSIGNIISGFNFLFWFKRKIEINNVDILWLSHPVHIYFKKSLKYKKLIYDIMDDFPEFNHSQKRKLFLLKCINKIIDAADHIFVTSEELNYSFIKNKNRVTLLPNAVDLKIFDINRKYAIPDDLGKIPSPRIGFAGYISHWVDLTIIYQAAEKFPNYNFIVIGPLHKKDHILPNMPNIFFLGEKKHTEIANYIFFFDAAIIPFKMNELTNKVNPLKLFEYASLNKPIIATDTRELRKYDNYCFLYSNSEEFNNLLRKIIERQIVFPDYLNLAKENSWDVRKKVIEDIIMTI